MTTKVCNRDGDKEEFDDRKVYASVYYPAREAGYSERDAEDLAEDVVADLTDWMDDHEDNVLTSTELREKVTELIAERDEDVSFMYETHLDLN